MRRYNTKPNSGSYKKGRTRSLEEIAKAVAGRAGYKHSEQTKKRIGLGNSENKIEKQCMVCSVAFQVTNWENKRKFCSHKCYSLTLRETFSKENNPRWKGGITPINKKIRESKEYADWRTTVFQRDDYTCQECGSRGYKLHADHIKPFAYFPELRLVIGNGRTLCVPCHKKTDSYMNRWYEKQTTNAGNFAGAVKVVDEPDSK